MSLVDRRGGNSMKIGREAVRFSISIVFVNFALALFLWTKESLDNYVAIVLPMTVMSIFFILIADIMKTSQSFIFANVILMNIGGAMQMLVGKESSSSFVMLQLATFVMAVAGVWLLIFIQHKVSVKTQLIMGIVAIVMLYLILFIFGSTINGTKAWIRFGNSEGALGIQLTELIKILSVYVLSIIFSNTKFSDLQTILFGGICIIVNVISLLCIREMGTLVMLVVVFIVYSFLYVKKLKFSVIITGTIGLLGGISLGVAAVFSKLYDGGLINVLTRLGADIWKKVYGRLQLLISLETVDPVTDGYQPMAAKNAITLGGWFGSQYNMKIPVEESDYIFASLLCNMGFVMGIIVLILFLSILFMGTRMIFEQKKDSEQVLAIGFLYMMVLQSLLTIFGSSNFFLLIGLPVAWLSAGGTNQLMVFLMMLYIAYAGRGIEIIGNKRRKITERKKICRIKE